jgi:hypothetical protein
MFTPNWRRSLAASAIAAPLLIGPATAMPADDAAARTAITTTATDRNDTEGPLDVRQVKHRIATHAHRTTLAFTVRTWRGFDNTDLSRRQRNVVLELDRDGKPGAERNVTIYSRGGGLRADLISTATREVIAHVTAVRIDKRTVGVVGPRRLLGVRRVFWTSNYHRSGVPACGWAGGYPITCQDTVPNRGWLRLDRRAWPVGQQST